MIDSSRLTFGEIRFCTIHKLPYKERFPFVVQALQRLAGKEVKNVQKWVARGGETQVQRHHREAKYEKGGVRRTLKFQRILHV